MSEFDLPLKESMKELILIKFEVLEQNIKFLERLGKGNILYVKVSGDLRAKNSKNPGFCAILAVRPPRSRMGDRAREALTAIRQAQHCQPLQRTNHDATVLTARSSLSQSICGL